MTGIVVTPTHVCAVCGHSRGDHETIERQWCGRCASQARSREAAHAYVEADPDAS